jgi:hypothetical protein
MVKCIPHILNPENFWRKAILTANAGLCWLWQGWIKDKKKPYGIISIDGKSFSAPRVAYFLYYQIDPKEMHVLHRCDNPRCINPEHLFLGTNDDNIKDKVSKGRQAKNTAWNKGTTGISPSGENNGTSKLTVEQVKEIRRRYSKGVVGTSRLAKEFSVSNQAVKNIIHNKTWRNI